MSLPVAILAGGLATRLGDVSKRIPKSLMEIAGKPFAEHQLLLLRKNGLRDVVFCVGHLGEMMQSSLGDGSKWGMSLRYSFDGPALLGTGGALRRALPFLGETFFVLYGDSYLDCDYRQVEAAFVASGKSALMTVYRNSDRWDRSNVLYLNGRILGYDKKNRTPEMQYIDYGIGILKAKALEAFPADLNFDLATVYQGLVGAGELAGYEVKERFYEIGSVAGLEETREYLARCPRP